MRNLTKSIRISVEYRDGANYKRLPNITISKAEIKALEEKKGGLKNHTGVFYD